jgi:DNA repair protein RecO (recombination protein O)
VLRRVEFGEADLILTLFTRALGRVSALARGARRNSRRFAGALEPFFTLGVVLEERRGVELMTLREATLVRPRTGLLADLSALSAAGRALGWVRRAAPVHTPEPEAWQIVEALLDRLAEPGAAGFAEPELARAGLRLLGAFGWALELERCVRCGKPCPSGRPSSLDLVRGGLVCRDCGGGRIRLAPEQRERLIAATRERTPLSLSNEEASLALDLVERVLDAHAGEV